MSAFIIGSPAVTASLPNSKVLRRQQYQKDMNGLESLVETYIVQTANRISLAPAKDTKHSDFSTASTKFQRMAVESISFDEQDGDVTAMSVNFAGLTSSDGLPPALVRIIPATGAGIFGPDINIEVEYVSDSTETQLVGGKFSSQQGVIATPINSKSKKMPSSINGVVLPSDPVAPFTFQSESSVSGVFQRYEGYVLKNVSCTRRGQFLVATLIFAENQVVIISESGGFENRFGA